jgi:hypothetical protein
MLEATPQPAVPQPVEMIEPPPLIEPPGVEADTGALPDFEDLFTETQPEPLNFLTRARMAARATPETPRPKPRYLIPVAVSLVIVLALAAGLVLHRRVETAAVAKPETAKADLAGPTYSVPVPPSTEDTQFVVAPDAATDQNTVAAPQPDSRDSAPRALAPLKPRTVRTAPVNPVPASAKTAATAPVDKVTQLADAGNPNALTILGLRALDGTGGVAVNLPDAVKYLSAAAEKGHAVAQYRLGTLYERGQGVAVDPIKA